MVKFFSGGYVVFFLKKMEIVKLTKVLHTSMQLQQQQLLQEKFEK